MARSGDDALEELHRAGVDRGDLVGLAVAPGVGVGMWAPAAGVAVVLTEDDPAPAVAHIDEVIRPRWVEWSQTTAAILVAAGVRLATAWDVAAVHRLTCGGWQADPGRVWAHLHGLPVESVPTVSPPDLFSLIATDGDPEEAVRPDGHLRPEWTSGAWSATPHRLARWAELAVVAAHLQAEALAALTDRPAATATARSESAAELLCAEMSFDGLPINRAAAEALIGGSVGPRARTEADAAAARARRDAEVLRHAGPGDGDVDLRSPGQVKALLGRVGIDVPDTRAGRLRPLRDQHPLVDAVLTWRKAERIATTYGYAWLDTHVGGDGRLRGEWTGSDGAAGRMTASSGLHNMPADMRSAVVAEPGHVFVRADLGQIEPRVLAAVSGDAKLARATREDDMYAPVAAAALDVDRATAKVAVLGAMYGQTTGHGAQALWRLKAAYPVAMAYLDEADVAGQVSRPLRTYGGRLIAMGSTNANDVSERAARSQAAARGRYGRNALVQGAAAELFKVWAVTVRARSQPLGARILLCLHDELLVQVPSDRGGELAALLDHCLQEAAHRWAPDHSVRFVADIAMISRWSDAKD